MANQKKELNLLQKQIVQKKSSIHSVLLMTVALTSTAFVPFIFDSFTAPKILMLYVGLTLSLIMLLYSKMRLKVNLNKPPKWIIAPLLIVFSLFLIEIINSHQPVFRTLYGQFGRGNGVLYYTGALLIMLLVAATYEKTSLLTLTKMIEIVSWIFGIYAIFQKIGIDFAQLDSKGLSKVILTFGNSNFSGAMLAILFTYTSARVFGKKKIELQEMILLLVLLMGVFFTEAFQGVLIVFLTIAILLPMWFYNQSRFKKFKKLVIYAWIISAVFLFLGVWGVGPMAMIFERPSFQMRMEYWKIGTRVILDNLLLGVGPDRLYDITPKYMTPEALKLLTDTRMDNPHNWFIHFGASFGVIGLIAFLTLISIVLVRTIKRFEGASFLYNPHFPIFLTLLAVVVDAMVSIEQPGLGIWMYLFLGYLIGFNIQNNEIQTHSDEKKTPIKNDKRTIIALAATLLVTGIFSATIALRMFNDGVLRHYVQASISNPSDVESMREVINATLKLKAEPEYMIQSIPTLAKAGDGESLLQISDVYYDFNPYSIQAIGIRAQILSIVKSVKSSCPLQRILVDNTPWRTESVEKFLFCEALGSYESDNRAILLLVSDYFSFTFRGYMESGNQYQKILAKALKVRLLHELGREVEAENLKRDLTPELEILKVNQPDQNYKNFEILLAGLQP